MNFKTTNKLLLVVACNLVGLSHASDKLHLSPITSALENLAKITTEVEEEIINSIESDRKNANTATKKRDSSPTDQNLLKLEMSTHKLELNVDSRVEVPRIKLSIQKPTQFTELLTVKSLNYNKYLPESGKMNTQKKSLASVEKQRLGPVEMAGRPNIHSRTVLVKKSTAMSNVSTQKLSGKKSNTKLTKSQKAVDKWMNAVDKLKFKQAAMKRKAYDFEKDIKTVEKWLAKPLPSSSVLKKPGVSNTVHGGNDYSPLVHKSMDSHLVTPEVNSAISRAVAKVQSSSVVNSSVVPLPSMAQNQQATDNSIYQNLNKSLAGYNPVNSNGQDNQSTTATSSAQSGPVVSPVDIAYKNFFVDENHNAVLNIRTVSVNLGTSVMGNIKSFGFEPMYDVYDYVESRDGALEISEDVNNQIGFIPGKIMAVDHMSIRTDIALEKGEFDVSIPMITMNSFNNLIADKQIPNSGGHVLIDKDDETSNVDIAADYEQKLYFNSDFVQVETIQEAKYILFVSVTPGFADINYNTYHLGHSSKAVLIEDAVIYFELNGYIKRNSKVINIHERTLAGRVSPALNLEKEHVKRFFSDQVADVHNGNYFEFTEFVTPLGIREYFSVVDGTEFVVGTLGDEEKIEIPGEGFRKKVIEEEFNLNDLEFHCLVDISMPLDKKIDSIKYSGITFDDEMDIEVKYLDEDGYFHNDYAAITKNMYLLGTQSGQMNLKIKYKDGTSDYLQSFCKQNTYLVEQL